MNYFHACFVQLFPSSKQRLRRRGHLIMNFVMNSEDNLYIYFYFSQTKTQNLISELKIK